MKNFSYQNPTQIEFGRGTIQSLSGLLPEDARVLLLYGGGSIKKNGVYDQVKTALAIPAPIVTEMSGIEPNPEYETCLKALDLIEEHNLNFILSVGGGSVLDAAKFIAAAAWARGNGTAMTEPWDLITGQAPIEGALPVGAVLTLPATGSEMNTNSVISRREIGQKIGFGSTHLYPRFSILDPETTFSLPLRQTANGIVDTFVHTTEQYLTQDVNTPIQDRWAEGILTTLIEVGPRCLKQPHAYQYRETLMWASTMALNGIIGVGTVQDWATHAIGHELTAMYGIDHGRTLAIVLPGLLSHEKQAKKDKLLMFARRVWGLSQGDETVLMDEAIGRMVLFFENLGVHTRLQEYHIPPSAPPLDECPGIIAEIFRKRGGKIGENQAIGPKEIEEILLSRL
ncbi:iron-containing alcohol dehydrogenase [Spirochaeta lutea]|uniref:Aldehyde reductase n=1 Tax=Spirochaeta lutea TaxID=1480694 RepID=A0A098QUY1_9SPIO|nr:iron-containing alcohol dehydrogenase [Spirochaeta lutea]KGE71665.1 aldehyde reductase [Spirochaeta lutea]